MNIIEEASKPLKREKEKQEIENLKEDTALTKTEIERLLEKRGAKPTYDSLVRRIRKKPNKNSRNQNTNNRQ